jgi:dipeptidyl-peptidase-3
VLSRVPLRNTRLRQINGDDEHKSFEVLVASIQDHPDDAITDVFRFPEQKGEVKVVYGDYKDQLRPMCENLKKAREFAANNLQKKYLAKLIRSYETGSIESHKEASISWVKDKDPPVETWSGFLEPGRDPSGVRCEFEALVAMPNKEQTRAFDELAGRATTFIVKLPWTGTAIGLAHDKAGPFENDEFVRPNFVGLDCKFFSASLNARLY